MSSNKDCEYSIDCNKCRSRGMCTSYANHMYSIGYQQGMADALNIDMDKPMHFTSEQKAWVKNYIIQNAKGVRADEKEKNINERAYLLAFICKKYSIPLIDMNCTVEEWEELGGGVMKPRWETKELDFRGTCINHAERRTAYCPCCDNPLEIGQEKCQKCGQKIDWKEFI